MLERAGAPAGRMSVPARKSRGFWLLVWLVLALASNDKRIERGCERELLLLLRY